MIINTLGAARNFPLEFRFCPKKFLGLEMPHPHIEQGILMTCIAVKHTLLSFHRFSLLIGSFIESSLEQLQLEIGCPNLALEADKGS